MIPQHRQPKSVGGERIIVIEPDVIEQTHARRGEDGVEERREMRGVKAAKAEPIAEPLQPGTEVKCEVLVQRQPRGDEGTLELPRTIADMRSDRFTRNAAFARADKIEEQFVRPIQIAAVVVEGD